MNLRRGLVMVVVAVVAACVTLGAGAAVLGGRRGPVAETKLASSKTGERFEWVDVFVRGEDGKGVGAWQVEVRGSGGLVQFVGVEGVEGGEPPFYDAAALSGGERLIVGGIRQDPKTSSSAAAKPAAPSPAEPGEGGKVRVARLHARVIGSVEYTGVLSALADAGGERIGGTVELVRGEAGQP